MNREFYLLIILGVMMVASSFGVYHFATAQINSSNIGLDNTSAVQTSNITSSVNNAQNEVGAINNANNWTIVSGNWSTQGASIHGGSSDNSTSPRSNIILNPETPENISKVSTTFRINNMDNTVANYARIVFSFTDPDNFRLAGINILKDTVYAVGYTVRDGDLNVAEPSWPGIPTNLTHTPDSTYNITLVKQDSSLQLLVNGTAYLTQSINNQINLGQVGLDYGRVQDIDFMDFITETGAQQLLTSNNTQINKVGDIFTTSDSQSVLLEGHSLPVNDYIHLYDTTPFQIVSGHVAAKLPCDDESNPQVSVLTGQAPNLSTTELEYIADLSDPGEICMYHVDIKASETGPVTDIAIANNSSEDIEFPDTSGVVINVNEIARIE